VLLGIAVVLGFVLGGYFAGLFRRCGWSARRDRPSLTLCDTQRSSFLFWSSETKECN
jgi:hypothetical protein